MSWFFSVALPPEPVGCHDAAATLRTVARSAAAAADLLDGQAVLSSEVFSGLAAQSYRAASAALGADSRGVATDARGLAAALDDYAGRVGAARDELVRVREAAVAAGFRVTDDLVQWVPEGVDGTHYQRLEGRARRAHLELESARAAWWRAVQELTTGPLAAADRAVPEPVEPIDVPEPRERRRHDPPPSAPPPVAAPSVTATAPAGAPYQPPAEPHDQLHHTPGPRSAASHRPPLPLHWAPLLPLHWAPTPLHWVPLPDPPACPTDPEGVLA